VLGELSNGRYGSLGKSINSKHITYLIDIIEDGELNLYLFVFKQLQKFRQDMLGGILFAYDHTET
jgi:hypothetical protein